ncbi:MAG: cysteine peptidase family C39 domain-containing protein [Polyangiaceae bacterium]
MTADAITFVPQVATNDCVVAALMMVLRLHGRSVGRGVVKRALGGTAHGASAASLVRAARELGLEARGLRVPLARIGELSRGSILHWQRRHFVVFDAPSGDGVFIVDPATGRRHVGATELATAFHGLAIAFECKPESEPASPEVPSPTRAMLARALVSPKTQKWLLASLVSAVVALTTLSAMSALAMGALVDRAAAREVAATRILPALVGVAALVFAAIALRERATARLRHALDEALGGAVRAALARADEAFFHERSSRDLLGRFAAGRSLAASSAQSLASLFGDLFAVLVFTILVARTSLPVLASVVALGSLQLGLLAFGRRAALSDAAAEDARITALARFEERLLDRPRALDADALASWAALEDEAREASSARGAQLLATVREGFGVLAPLVVMAVAALDAARGGLSAGAMVTVNCAAICLLRPLTSVFAVLDRAREDRLRIERLDDLLATSRDVEHDAHARPSHPDVLVELRGVGFRAYPEAQPVLERTDLAIERGKTTLITGMSGSGKSLLGSIIEGATKPTTGEVLRAPVRCERVTERLVFHEGTLTENVARGAARSSSREVTKVLDIVGARAGIEALPLGAETRIGDGGGGLPTGLLRRVAIARSLYREPELLVLDGALDGLADAEVRALLAAIRAARPSLALVVSSHSSGAIAAADTIVLLDPFARSAS